MGCLLGKVFFIFHLLNKGNRIPNFFFGALFCFNLENLPSFLPPPRPSNLLTSAFHTSFEGRKKKIKSARERTRQKTKTKKKFSFYIYIYKPTNIPIPIPFFIFFNFSLTCFFNNYHYDLTYQFQLSLIYSCQLKDFQKL